MREIPDLQVLCLRAVGSQACSAEETFAKLKDGQSSSASRLLLSFHKRSELLQRRPCIGSGSARRVNANEVDLHHPVIGCRKQPSADEEQGVPAATLIMEYGNPALDCLQAYIDSLVELGRMDDGRLGIHFFQAWKSNLGGVDTAAVVAAPSRSKKRRRSGDKANDKVTLCSLSLHNCSVAGETFEAMVKSGIGPNLAVLDLTGIRGLTDDWLRPILNVASNLERLSLKNCRKITCKSTKFLEAHATKLQSLDVGGCFNLDASDVLSLVPALPDLSQLHASGLPWKDESVAQLVELRDTWTTLSLGFSSKVITQQGVRDALFQVGSSLVSLSLPFCETIVDNALLGTLGRNMPHIQHLDLRGNPNLNTVTGWYDGRASAGLKAQTLVILARYTSLNESSVEETKRVHPQPTEKLTVILDSGGMGLGIVREEQQGNEE